MRKERKGKGESAAKGKRPPCGLPAPKGPTWATGISKDKGCAQKRAEPRWLRGRSSRPGTRPGVPGFRLWTLGIQTLRAGFWGPSLEGQRHEVAEEQEKTLKPLRLKGFLPVSYTHLDVYKRQRQRKPPLPKPRKRQPPDPFQTYLIVSYTHLDVYKRQAC